MYFLLIWIMFARVWHDGTFIANDKIVYVMCKPERNIYISISVYSIYLFINIFKFNFSILNSGFFPDIIFNWNGECHSSKISPIWINISLGGAVWEKESNWISEKHSTFLKQRNTCFQVYLQLTINRVFFKSSSVSLFN